MSPKNDYISAITEEINLRKEYVGGEAIKTIYLGGGTPSQLPIPDIERMFEAIYSEFKVASDAEITLEANPDDLSLKYLEELRQLPFNRISIGVQSFNDSELKFLKRRHSAQKAIDAVSLAKSVGLENISVDLMYGLPNQTMEIWNDNLSKVIDLDIQHISSYHLIYERDTKLYRLLKKGEVRQVEEELSVNMFSVMIERLASAGFEHYEISNFARKSLYSKHNSSYWLGEKYLGLGPAAHSYNGINRSWNVSSISKYIEGIKKQVPSIEIEELDIYTRYNDFILTGMRTMWGVNLTELENKFGNNLLTYCLKNSQKHIDNKHVIDKENILKLTKKGIFISDSIMSDMMYV